MSAEPTRAPVALRPVALALALVANEVVSAPPAPPAADPRAAQRTRKRRQDAQKKASTRVRKNADASEVQRIVQCDCGASMQLWPARRSGQPLGPEAEALDRGLAAVRAAGWRSKWVPARTGDSQRNPVDAPLVQVWFCGEHWVAPVFVEPPRVFRVPPAAIEIAGRRSDCAKRQSLERDVLQLVAIDPEMGKAWLAIIIGGVGEASAKSWRKLFDRVDRTRGAGGQESQER